MGWLLAALFGYGLVVAGVYAGQRSLQYFPARAVPDPARVTGGAMAAVSYRSADGLALTSWFAPPAEGRPVLVHFQGNAGHIGDRAPLMQPYVSSGYGVLLVGYRGYGGNPGKPTEAGLYADGRAALDWLAGQGLGPDSLILYGESLGTGIAVQMAVERPVAALVLEAPFTSAVDVGQAAYRWLPVGLLMWDRFDNLSKIGALSAPLLLIHGESDRVVPTRLGRRLFEAAPEPKTARFIAGAGHNDLHLYGLPETVLTFLSGLPDAGSTGD